MHDQRTLTVADRSSHDGAEAAAGEWPVRVRVEGVSAGYGGPPVLEDISFALHGGERVAVLGPNGGGKTTLFRVLIGELKPLAGLVDVPERCGLVPQTERSRLDFPVSALDVALMGGVSARPWWRLAGRADRARARDTLGTVGLADRADATFGELSGGQRQRVLVARALVQDAPVVLLDEPFSGLDRPSAERLDALLDRLAGDGRTVMIATHDIDQARRWDRILCLNHRVIALGAPGDVLTRQTLQATYGAAAVVSLPGDEGSIVLPPQDHTEP